MSYKGRALTAGNYLKLDDLQSQFNSSTTTFSLTSGGTAFYPGSAFSILVSLAGVVQEPESAYTIDQSQITFASAPGSGDDFFCIALGVSLGIGVPGEGTVTGTKLSKPFSYDDGLLVLDSTNNFIGVNSTTPTVALDIIGNAKITGISTLGITSTTNLTTQSLVVSGISTLGITSTTNLTTKSLVVSGISTLGTVVVGGATTALIVTGNARITGILTVGTGSITIDGINNIISGVTQNNSTNINVSGISTFGDTTVTSLNGGPIAGTRNRIINGDMRIDQRATVATTNDTYVTDRWQLSFSTTGAIQAAQSGDFPATFSQSLLFDVTTADTSIAAGEFAGFFHYIEGLNTADFAWGTASAQTVTLSFWVKSTTTGTYCVNFGNSANNRAYIAEYSIAAANTWEKKTITIVGDTTGTWLTSTGRGVRVSFIFACGSTYHATANSWGAGNFFATSNQVNLLASATNEIRITGVQLEPGSTATPFERRSYGQELALCQRYYEKSYDLATAPGAVTTNGQVVSQINFTSGTTDLQFAVAFFNVRKRATPTVAVYSPASGNAARTRDTIGGSDITSISVSGSESNLGVQTYPLTSRGSQVVSFQWTASAEL